AFDGAGVGGAWPLLTGERGHYELEAGRDALPFIKTLERFANAGGMLPEQVWFGDDLPGTRFKRGLPTGSAMPLCWAHAEYLILVRSHADGVSFDRVGPAHQRYVEQRTGSEFEMWTCAHRRGRIPAGKTLRVITSSPAVIHWREAGGAGGEVSASETALGVWFADLPTSALPAGTQIEFVLSCAEKEDAEPRRVVIIS
ncbi:MAG: glucoamylase, partial [Chthoniobacterales bacterium]